MREANVSSVLVGDGAAMATERDLARALAAGMGPDEPITTVASAYPVRVPADTSVVDAAALMLNEEIRHLLIDGDDGTVSVLSLREVMAVLLQMASPHRWLATLRVAVSTPPESWLG
jgi:acetyl-CoA synthetase